MAMDEASQRVSRFLLSQLVVNSCFGTAVGLGLWAIGVPDSAIWGSLAAILRFVPYLGVVAACVTRQWRANLAYPAAALWGLAAIAVANRAAGGVEMVAVVAGAAAVLVLLAAIFRKRMRRAEA